MIYQYKKHVASVEEFHSFALALRAASLSFSANPTADGWLFRYAATHPQQDQVTDYYADNMHTLSLPEKMTPQPKAPPDAAPSVDDESQPVPDVGPES